MKEEGYMFRYESEKEREKRCERKYEKIGREMAKRIIKDAKRASGLN